jgi:hypothetical protein
MELPLELASPVFNHTRLSGTNEIRLACLVGNIYCTTNGIDPRQGGGQPSPDAFEYRSPVQLPHGTPFTARVRSDDGLWSAPVRLEGTPKGKQATATKDAQREHTNFTIPLARDPRSKASSPISIFLLRVVARRCLSLRVGA